MEKQFNEQEFTDEEEFKENLKVYEELNAKLKETVLF